MQTNLGIDFSGASYGEFASFHWLSFPPSLKPQRPKRWQYRRKPQWAMRGMRLRNVGCAAKGTMPRPGPLVDGRRAGDVERGDRGKVFGVVLLAVEEVLSNQSRGKPVRFPGALELDIPLSSLYTAQIREEHACCGSHGPLCLFDPCRLGLFLAYCAKGSNRSNFQWFWLPRWPRWEIAPYLYGACKHVSKFLKLPSRQCSASRVLEHLLQFHSLPPKRVPVFQVPPVVRSIGLVKRKFHKVIGGMRCGPARRWVQENLDVRKTSGKMWLRFFNGKRVLREMLSEEFKEWDVDKFAEALVLRSLRAVLGVWRLPVWEHAEDINSECFSCLGSSSFRTRISQRVHNQLYGTMCGILESIHQVRAPPALWGELEVPPRAAVRDSDVLLADDREANKAWCVDRQELFLYLTSSTVTRLAHLDTPEWASRERRLHTSPHQVCFGPSWLETCRIPRGWRRSSCLHVSTGQIQVFPGFWCSSVLQSWAFLHEESD